MANVSDKELAIARVYANSMLQLAEEQGQADELLAQLRDLAGYLDQHPEFDAFLSSPMIDGKAREKTLEKVFRGKVSDLLADSLQVLNRKERLDILRSVAEAYRLAHQEARGVVDVHVRTAVPLTNSLRRQLREAVARHTGKEVQLVETVDESIIGGMILRIDDEKFDGSVIAKLSKLGLSLTDRASREIHSGKSYVTAG